jgi:glutathione peroxidase
VHYFFSVAKSGTKQKKLNKSEIAMEKQNIYQFKVEDLSGNVFDFQLKKKKK